MAIQTNKEKLRLQSLSVRFRTELEKIKKGHEIELEAKMEEMEIKHENQQQLLIEQLKG